MSLESDEQWLQRNLPEALDAFRLWRNTRAMRALAQRLALKERHGETLVAPYTEALRTAALLYLTHLGAAQDLTDLAIGLELVIPPELVHLPNLLKRDRLSALAVEPSEDA